MISALKNWLKIILLRRCPLQQKKNAQEFAVRAISLESTPTADETDSKSFEASQQLRAAPSTDRLGGRGVQLRLLS